jgi:hypothetical protein
VLILQEAAEAVAHTKTIATLVMPMQEVGEDLVGAKVEEEE